MTTPLSVGLLGTYAGYEEAFMFRLIRHLSRRPVKLVNSIYCDLLIVGPFAERKLKKAEKKFRFWQEHPSLARLTSKNRPMVLMHLAENIRPDFFPADFIISSDFCGLSTNQIRFPYWMEMLDWSSQGLNIGATNPRYGRLLSIERLMQPLGSDYLRRSQRAVIFSSHMREPRKSLITAMEKFMPVDGFGPAFDSRIKNHSASDLEKQEVLKSYAFNLCPENALYPGYYTEKIPEAFHAGCVPVTWCDEHVSIDFNPKALLNLASDKIGAYESGYYEMQRNPSDFVCIDEPLLIKAPTIDELLSFTDGFLRS